MKRTIAIIVLLALMIPITAFASQAPGARDSQAGQHQYGQTDNPVSEYGENRGVVPWANNLFWYQLYNIYRWSVIWRF